MNTRHQQRPDADTMLAAVASARIDGKNLPEHILLTPWGEVESANGNFFVDEESAEQARRAFDRHGTDLPIDYEHQTLGGPYAAPDGKAPAAGWIKHIEGRPGSGIRGTIEWTPRAGQMLEQREYRYLSPVALVRKSDRKLLAIHSAALTNKPAIVGMAPIVNRHQPPDDNNVSPTAAESLCRTLGIADPTTDPNELLAAAQQRLTHLHRTLRDRDIEQAVQRALDSGKLAPAQQDWARNMLADAPQLFEEWLQSAPALVATGCLVDAEPVAPTAAAEHKARAEFRANPWLAALTSEDAYADDARRASPVNPK